MSYTFNNLSYLDFEKLIIDLLQEEYKTFIETFSPGKDQGIDGRFFSVTKKATIIQAKHYSIFSNLKNHLKKKELSKVKNLKPSNYVLATSCSLSVSQKDKIKNIFKDHVKDKTTILGNEDINNLIRKYPSVEEKNFKLWLGSTNILKQILHSGTINESEAMGRQLRNKALVYVKNDSFVEALKFLNKHNCCIISGEPGVGKTTLAQMLCFYYMKCGYKFLKVSSNIKEGYKFLKSKKKTVFYYDDFLGRTFLENPLEKNEDSRIVNFLKEVSNSSNQHKIVLTTREYILQQSYRVHENFCHYNLEIKKYILSLSEYTNYDKAMILYNHLYYSDIEKNYIQTLVEDRAYFKIVQHRNFNPRLIELMTKMDRLFLKNVKPTDYSKYFICNLDNPKQIWEHAFSELSNATQNLILTIATFGGTVSFQNLEDSYKVLNKKLCSENNIRSTLEDFNRALEEAEGSFISHKINSSSPHSKQETINFINPSVSDFIENYISRNIALCSHLINHSTFTKQVERTIKLSCEKNIFEKVLENIKSKLLEINNLKKLEHEKIKHIFYEVFKESNEQLIKRNESFFKDFVGIFWNCINVPMWESNISLEQALLCLDVFEKKKTLYFNKREFFKKKAKDVFCADIDSTDFIAVKEFINDFPDFVDENSVQSVDEQVESYIEDTYNELNNSSVEEMRAVAEELEEIEQAYDLE